MRIQPESRALQKVLEENILPQVKDEYYEKHPSDPDVRINVMILRRRNTNYFRRNRPDVKPWEKTLRIEAHLGEYEQRREDELEWKRDEGAVWRAMNKKAQEIWAPLDYDDTGRVEAGWAMTKAQARRTDHLKSLLSIPIYLQSDEDKVNPVGVLNLDSEQPLEETKFGDEDIRESIIKHANIIGAIIE